MKSPRNGESYYGDFSVIFCGTEGFIDHSVDKSTQTAGNYTHLHADELSV